MKPSSYIIGDYPKGSTLQRSPKPPKKPEPKKPLPPKEKARPVETFQSTIVEWNDEKGFGFLAHKKRKLFIHAKDFAERHKRPEVGDRITYQVGSDPKGRTCAVGAIHVNDGGRLTLGSFSRLSLLLAVPLFALKALIDTHKAPALYGCAILLVVNLITYHTYKSDKNKAKTKRWRTSESSLHFLELIGGWPAAFLAQRKFRHKCSKTSFQATYWMIVMLHIYVSADFLRNWKITNTIVEMVKTLAESR